MGFLNRYFCCSERLVCYIKRRKFFFSRFIFTIYEKGIQRVTRCYRGLQEVTRGYRGLQGITRGYRELQGVIRDDKGRQGVTGGTKDYRILFSN